MADLSTMVWKEASEFFGNRRFLRIFLIAVLVMGLLPELERRHVAAGNANAAHLLTLLSLGYAVLAAVILVAQTAPDLVLRERSGRTLDYLLGTRLSDGAIFGGKVIVAAAVGYCSSLATIVIQIVATNVIGHTGPWTWSYLAWPQGRLLALLLTPSVAVYLATVGSFVALRVGEQRTAYLITMLSIGLLILPFLLGILHLHFNMPWLLRAVGVLALVAVAVVAIGARLFRREHLVLSLQE